MPNGRLVIEPPQFTPSPYGLLTVATDVTAIVGDSHWQAGVTWRSLCANGAATFDECLAVTGTGELPAPAPKEATGEYQFRGATPFTVYSRLDCSPVGSWNTIVNDARDALTRTEGWVVERAFWTGIAADRDAAAPVVVHPHLAADTELLDPNSDEPEVILQPAATEVLETAVDIVTGLGALEQALGNCYQGVGVIHVPVNLLPQLVAWNLVTLRNGRYITDNGHLVAAGAGYDGSAPDGTPANATTWMYATGAVFYLRSDVIAFDRPSTMDREVNTMEVLAERNYVVGWDCCLLAVPITTDFDGTP